MKIGIGFSARAEDGLSIPADIDLIFKKGTL
jgi:hypothetical protein